MRMTLNPYQEKLFKELTKGYCYYQQSELDRMSEFSKKLLKIRYNQAKIAINELKNDVVMYYIKSLFKGKWNESCTAVAILNQPLTVKQFKYELSCKELNITQDMIIKKFISSKLLPVDFYEKAA